MCINRRALPLLRAMNNPVLQGLSQFCVLKQTFLPHLSVAPAVWTPDSPPPFKSQGIEAGSRWRQQQERAALGAVEHLKMVHNDSGYCTKAYMLWKRWSVSCCVMDWNRIASYLLCLGSRATTAVLSRIFARPVLFQWVLAMMQSLKNTLSLNTPLYNDRSRPLRSLRPSCWQCSVV